MAGIIAIIPKLKLVEPPINKATNKDESYLKHLGKSIRISTGGAVGYFVFYAAVVWFGFIYAIQNLIGGYSSRQAYLV